MKLIFQYQDAEAVRVEKGEDVSGMRSELVLWRLDEPIYDDEYRIVGTATDYIITSVYLEVDGAVTLQYIRTFDSKEEAERDYEDWVAETDADYTAFA